MWMTSKPSLSQSISRPRPTTSSPWLPAALVVRLGLVGGLLQICGGTWDIAWHIDRGRDSLLSPPHLVLYAGIVLVLTAAAVGVTAAATSGESLLRQLQQSPPLTAIVLATLFELSSAPIDEYWHRTFGRDVTVLSPPHLILIFGSSAPPQPFWPWLPSSSGRSRSSSRPTGQCLCWIISPCWC